MCKEAKTSPFITELSKRIGRIKTGKSAQAEGHGFAVVNIGGTQLTVSL